MQSDHACAVYREITRFNNQIKQEQAGLPQIKMRIGIHTGPVVVGTLGNDLRVEFKAIGDTVNLVSRIGGRCLIALTTGKLRKHLSRRGPSLLDPAGCSSTVPCLPL